MPPKPTILERVVLATNAGPAPVLDFLGAMGLQAFFVALRLGLVDLLAERPRELREAADELGTDVRATELLFASLESVGYVRRRGDRYALTAMAAKWSPRLANGLEFYERMALDEWGEVARRIRGETNGSAPANGAEGGLARRSAEDEREIQAGMLANARLAADELTWRVRLPRRARRLLDVGGGHGYYAVRFCQRHPRLAATVFDRDEALAVASDVADEAGLAERVRLEAGDFWRDDLGRDYDVALVFNLLNAYEDERKVELLRRVTRALAPGGVVVVLDGMRGQAKRGLARAIVELSTLRMFDPAHATTYGLAQLQGWFRSAGLRPRRAGALRSIPWVGFATARKAGDA